MTAMIIGIAFAALTPPGIPALATLICRGFRVSMPAREYFFRWMTTGAAFIVAEIINGTPWKLIAAIASTVIAAICWWLSRRKRKRSAKLIGEKSRALLAAAVARMRETAKPRPVLRPAPGGAR